MRQISIRKNYIYNLIYQLLTILAPLITTPYLSRVLGADGIGTVSYAESISSYFVLVASLGIATFGQREISYVQDDKEKRSAVFWETKLLQIITGSIVLIVYVLFAGFQNNRALYIILSFNIVSIIVDATWFFQGMEEFGKIVGRNTIIKLVQIAYIFLFVREKNDILIYAFGISIFVVLGNMSLWAYLPKYVSRPVFSALKPFRNIRTVITLFIPTVAIQIYTVFDKTMIGLITQDPFQNGYYEQSIKIAKVTLALVTALSTVMIPRIGYHFGKGEIEHVKTLMYRSYRFVWLLGIPLCFGQIVVAKNFVPWFFGDGFLDVIPLMHILSFLILAIGISNVTGMQYLIPTKRQNLFTVTVVIGAIVNFCLNLVLIRYYQAVGAAIASVAAETTITVAQLVAVRKELSARTILASCKSYLAAGIIMYLVLYYIGNKLAPTIMNTVIMVVIGALIYFCILLLFRDSFFIENIQRVLTFLNQKLGFKRRDK